MTPIEESLAKAERVLQEHYRKQLEQLEEKYKDVNQLPIEAINAIGKLKDKIK